MTSAWYLLALWLMLLLTVSFCEQKDHDAAFMWNGVNYLLKMPSDLDYLADYLAIKRWVGFPLVRNPFCVPYLLTGTLALVLASRTSSLTVPLNYVRRSIGKP
jgi:hypothetical protein